MISVDTSSYFNVKNRRSVQHLGLFILYLCIFSCRFVVIVSKIAVGLTRKATVYVHGNDVMCYPVERFGSVVQQKELCQDLNVQTILISTYDDAIVESVFTLEFLRKNVKYHLT